MFGRFRLWCDPGLAYPQIGSVASLIIEARVCTIQWRLSSLLGMSVICTGDILQTLCGPGVHGCRVIILTKHDKLLASCVAELIKGPSYVVENDLAPALHNNSSRPRSSLRVINMTIEINLQDSRYDRAT